MLLTKNEIDIANLKLGQIASTLLSLDLKIPAMNLMGGKIGHALFFYYYFKYTNNESFLEKCVNILSEATNETLVNQLNYYSFGGGIAGFGWLLNLFKQDNIIELEDNDFFSELSQVLYAEMRYFLDKNNFDFLYGAVGICWYFLKGNHDSIHNEKIEYFLKFKILYAL